VDWMPLAQDRVQYQALLNTVMNFQGNLLSRCMTVRFSRNSQPVELLSQGVI
jgi:prophage DNA circulation protein